MWQKEENVVSVFFVLLKQKTHELSFSDASFKIYYSSLNLSHYSAAVDSSLHLFYPHVVREMYQVVFEFFMAWWLLRCRFIKSHCKLPFSMYISSLTHSLTHIRVSIHLRKPRALFDLINFFSCDMSWNHRHLSTTLDRHVRQQKAKASQNHL